MMAKKKPAHETAVTCVLTLILETSPPPALSETELLVFWAILRDQLNFIADTFFPLDKVPEMIERLNEAHRLILLLDIPEKNREDAAQLVAEGIKELKSRTSEGGESPAWTVALANSGS